MTSSTSLFFPMIAMIVIWYFLLIRPQQKRMKDHKELISNMKKGDNVVTQSGIYGKIVSVKADGNEAELEIAKGVNVKILKSTVQNILSK